MDETDDLRAARAMRRAVLGDAYVDGQTTDPSPVMAEFQDHLTSMAWGAWARGGALSVRDRTGVTDDELDELLFQIAVYCGAPAAVAARRALQAVRAEREAARP